MIFCCTGVSGAVRGVITSCLGMITACLGMITSRRGVVCFSPGVANRGASSSKSLRREDRPLRPLHRATRDIPSLSPRERAGVRAFFSLSPRERAGVRALATVRSRLPPPSRMMYTRPFRQV
jgi:hypothetical protein